MRETEGILFDIYVSGQEARLWILTEDGAELFHHAYHPKVYLEGKRNVITELVSRLEKQRLILGKRWTEKIEFWSADLIKVLELEVAGAPHYEKLSEILPSYDGPLHIYNADLPLAQTYLYETGLFPCGHVHVETEGQEIQKIEATESAWQDLQLPPLRTITLEPLRKSPNRFPGLRISWEGKDHEIDPEGPEALVTELNNVIERADPDLLLTSQGDTLLFPWLLRAEALAKARLNLDRDAAVPKRSLRTKGRSYFTYGRILYSPPRYPLFGRWHIDKEASFMYREAGLDGIVELSRLAKIPVQTTARTSPGTAISSMQLDEAFRQNILVPWRKGEPEAFKTPWKLFIADKGSLTYSPEVGAFENVAEIDFASMYPAIMVAHNISPETMQCSCCEKDGEKVPESGYHICKRRHGLVPKVLAPILDRREALKRRKKLASNDRDRIHFDKRQTALKWILVTCFGYLGYKNARFGKIEAHEAVTAFGREKLLHAKEIAETQGYRILHALTDSLWIHQGDIGKEALCKSIDKIVEATRIPMALEGVYRWLHFLPSKRRPSVGTPSRFFGVLKNGNLKARGLAHRRSDTPRFIKEAQLSILKILSNARDLKEYHALFGKAEEEHKQWREELQSGNVSPWRLVMTRRLTRDVNSYKTDTWTSLAGRQYEQAGIKLHAGERISFLLKNVLDPLKQERVIAAPFIKPEDNYDLRKYDQILNHAVEELWCTTLRRDVSSPVDPHSSLLLPLS